MLSDAIMDLIAKSFGAATANIYWSELMWVTLSLRVDSWKICNNAKPKINRLKSAFIERSAITNTNLFRINHSSLSVLCTFSEEESAYGHRRAKKLKEQGVKSSNDRIRPLMKEL